MDLRESAQAYLNDAPARWASFAHALGKQVATDLARRVVRQHPDLDGNNIAEALSEMLVSVLLMPQNVLLVARSNADALAIGEIADSVLASLDEAESMSIDEVDLVVSLDQRVVVPRSWIEFDGNEDTSLLSIRHALRAYLNRRRLRELISSCSGVSVGPQAAERDADVQTLIRLDVIDLALYRALARHPELLKTLDWRIFEKLLASVLESFGYEIELQRGTKDGGIDIFAIRHDQLGPHRYILQAKRWSHKVSVEPVRQLLFLHSHHHATKSCLGCVDIHASQMMAAARATKEAKRSASLS